MGRRRALPLPRAADPAGAGVRTVEGRIRTRRPGIVGDSDDAGARHRHANAYRDGYTDGYAGYVDTDVNAAADRRADTNDGVDTDAARDCRHGNASADGYGDAYRRGDGRDVMAAVRI